MGLNDIEIYKGTTRTIKCTVTGLANLDGYTATLTVIKKREDTDVVITKEGTIAGLVITFALTPTLTDVDIYEYVYYITIDDETDRHPIVDAILEVVYSPPRP